MKFNKYIKTILENSEEEQQSKFLLKYPDIKLTKREKDWLNWSIDGLTAKLDDPMDEEFLEENPNGWDLDAQVNEIDYFIHDLAYGHALNQKESNLHVDAVGNLYDKLKKIGYFEPEYHLGLPRVIKQVRIVLPPRPNRN